MMLLCAAPEDFWAFPLNRGLYPALLPVQEKGAGTFVKRDGRRSTDPCKRRAGSGRAAVGSASNRVAHHCGQTVSSDKEDPQV